jgi:putative DNA primase/helicase
VWAALTLVQAWLDARRPRGTVRLGRYESWSEVIGGILTVADVPGFLANLDDLYAQADAEGQQWSEFVFAWWAQEGNRAVKVHDLIGLAEQHLGEGNDRSARTRFGMMLTSKRDRLISGYRITAVDTHQGARRWRLVPVSQ